MQPCGFPSQMGRVLIAEKENRPFVERKKFGFCDGVRKGRILLRQAAASSGEFASRVGGRAHQRTGIGGSVQERKSFVRWKRIDNQNFAADLRRRCEFQVREAAAQKVLGRAKTAGRSWGTDIREEGMAVFSEQL